MKKKGFGIIGGFLSVVVLIVALLAVSCGNSVKDFTFKIEEDEAYITGYKGNSLNITIPSKLNGKKVTRISGEAFQDKGLSGVTIPNSVTLIGDSAFEDNKITSVTIPNSVTSIGSRAFAKNQLTSITIPDSVIALDGFSENQLTSVTIPDSVEIINGRAFRGNQLTSVIIGNGVTDIVSGAFESNSLTSITIGAGVNVMGSAFGYEDSFQKAYNNNGRKAGTYTRLNAESTEWTVK